jgi:protocatechuate 3,4-dioxygenase beta subunit
MNFSHGGMPVGERTLLHGRVLDENARPVPGTLVEIWRANASGRYRHGKDVYLGALDPNFGGCGRTLADENGTYVFRTIKPGPYPWLNYVNSGRPRRIHVLAFGTAFSQRLITQLYFEGDPLIPLCPIVQTIPDPAPPQRLIAALDRNASVPMDCMAYRFGFVLHGRPSSPF